MRISRKQNLRNTSESLKPYKMDCSIADPASGEYSLNAETHCSLDGLAVSDQVGSIFVLLSQQTLTFLLADGAVVVHGQRRSHVLTPTTPNRVLSTVSCLQTAALLSGLQLDMWVVSSQQRAYRRKEVRRNTRRWFSDEQNERHIHRKCAWVREKKRCTNNHIRKLMCASGDKFLLIATSDM